MTENRIRTRRRWVTAYALRVGPLVNLATFAAIGIGQLIWLAYDEDGWPIGPDDTLYPIGPSDLGRYAGSSIFASIIATMIALLLGHLLASIPTVRASAGRIRAVFEATSAIVVAGPVALALGFLYGSGFAVVAAAAHVVLIVTVTRQVHRRLGPYPAPPTDF